MPIQILTYCGEGPVSEHPFPIGRDAPNLCAHVLSALQEGLSGLLDGYEWEQDAASAKLATLFDLLQVQRHDRIRILALNPSIFPSFGRCYHPP